MIKLLIEEYLDEMATIYKSKEYGILVAVNPDSKRSGLPYFKFYNSFDYNRATHVIRIMFKEPDYIVHKDSKKLWKLNSKDKKLLIKIMKEESNTYSGRTNWQAALFDWNFEYLEEMINADKFFNGEYDEIYASNPGYIQSTLKMPDYTKINF